MAGTHDGGKKAAITTKERHGEDFHRINGKAGGAATGVEKGFAANRELAAEAGRRGGLERARRSRGY